MSEDLPSGYRIERPDLSWENSYVEAYVTNGDSDTSATLKFQLAEVAELKAAAAEKLAKEKRLAQLRSKVSETELKVKVPGADSDDSGLEIWGPAIVTTKGDKKVISFYQNLDWGSEIVSAEVVYDKQGRLVSLYNHSYSEGDDLDDWSTFEYDNNGRLKRKVDTTCWEGAHYNDKKASEPLGPKPRERYDSKYVTEYEYDERGNIITRDETGYDANYTVEYSDDGEVVVSPKIQESKGYRSIDHMTYDSKNRVLSVKCEQIDYNGSGKPRTVSSTDYTYHSNGGRTETYETGKKVVYDAQDRVIKKSSPDGNSSTFKYDKDDHLVETCKYKRDKLVSKLTKERAKQTYNGR
jgi:YD repeat-containing protein